MSAYARGFDYAHHRSNCSLCRRRDRLKLKIFTVTSALSLLGMGIVTWAIVR